MKFDVMIEQFKLKSWEYVRVQFIETREIAAVLQTASKDFNVGMHSDACEWIWFKLDLVIDTIVLNIFV